MKLAPILTLAFSAIAKLVLGECVTGITGFTLIAADSNTDIGTLAGMNFALNDPSFLYNIRADFKDCNPGGTIESVRFFFDGVEERCKNVTPYAWLGDPSNADLGDIGDFNGAPITPGNHTFQAIPYPENDCTGAPFEPLEETFHVTSMLPSVSIQDNSQVSNMIPSLTIAHFVSLMLVCALLAFGPFLSLFFLVTGPTKKAQVAIVATSAAFFFLLGSVAASFSSWVCDAIGLGGPLVANISGVGFQFIARCLFAALCLRMEHHVTEATVRWVPRDECLADWLQESRVAAGVGFGGMHAILLFGTMLESQTTNNAGLLYQDREIMPALAISGIVAFAFTVLDVFWMLVTFSGMQRRLLYPIGHKSRTNGDLALLFFCLILHFGASHVTTLIYFEAGCSVSVYADGLAVLVTAHGLGICTTVLT